MDTLNGAGNFRQHLNARLGPDRESFNRNAGGFIVRADNSDV